MTEKGEGEERAESEDTRAAIPRHCALGDCGAREGGWPWRRCQKPLGDSGWKVKGQGGIQAAWKSQEARQGDPGAVPNR